MDPIIKRFILFLGFCITLRFFLAYKSRYVDKQNLKILGYLAIIPAIGFLVIYLFNLRPTGPETFGKKIWWDRLRPIHAGLYFLFAYLAVNGREDAWKALFIDAVVGLNAFILYHAGNLL
jgi:hypothetical protein